MKCTKMSSFYLNITISNILPFSITWASITASIGGGSIALLRNCPISPSRNNLIDKAISCKGVRKISGVI